MPGEFFHSAMKLPLAEHTLTYIQLKEKEKRSHLPVTVPTVVRVHMPKGLYL